MLILEQFLPGLLVAALAGVSLLALLRVFWGSCRCATALALGCGYVCGHAVAFGWPPFPGREVTEWLLWFAVIAAAAAAVDSSLRLNRGWRVGSWLIVCAVLLRLLLRSQFAYRWQTLE